MTALPVCLSADVLLLEMHPMDSFLFVDGGNGDGDGGDCGADGGGDTVDFLVFVVVALSWASSNLFRIFAVVLVVVVLLTNIEALQLLSSTATDICSISFSVIGKFTPFFGFVVPCRCIIFYKNKKVHMSQLF